MGMVTDYLTCPRGSHSVRIAEQLSRYRAVGAGGSEGGSVQLRDESWAVDILRGVRAIEKAGPESGPHLLTKRAASRAARRGSLETLDESGAEHTKALVRS